MWIGERKIVSVKKNKQINKIKKLVSIICPVYNEEDAFAVEMNTNKKIKVVDSEGDLTRVEFYVNNGFKVFIPVTHQKLINSSNKFFIDNIVCFSYHYKN